MAHGTGACQARSVDVPAVDPALTLRSGPVRLRPWRPEDVDDAAAAVGDPSIALWNGLAATDRAYVADWVARRADWSDGEHVSLAVEHDEVPGLAGSVSLHRIDLGQGDAELGYWTAPGARRLGVAATAVILMYRWAFAALPLDRIELFSAVENEASSAVAARAGFVREGRLRQAYRYGDGRKHDEFLWSRLRDDPPVDC